ncbi:hypothetical protein [Archaeoglobus sp.]
MKVRSITATGEKRIIRWYSTSLRKDRKTLGTVSSGEDVTGKIKFERELKELLHTYELSLISFL